MTVKEKIENIRQSAHQLHESVNQYYDKKHPYSLHLDMVATVAECYADKVLETEDDRLPLMFGVYYHDSIEDARVTYNDITKMAQMYMSESQAYMAAEIVYALTNDKGRNRAERAGEKYYEGIRNTPYAPFAKLCDRIANARYSHDTAMVNAFNNHMKTVYTDELPHFISAISPNGNNDKRFSLPKEMINELYELLR